MVNDSFRRFAHRTFEVVGTSWAFILAVDSLSASETAFRMRA
jgi:hypothetical protein